VGATVLVVGAALALRKPKPIVEDDDDGDVAEQFELLDDEDDDDEEEEEDDETDEDGTAKRGVVDVVTKPE
jgi:hypothetical protein